MAGKFNFIIIDDSELDCFIAEKMIKHTGKSEIIKSFMSATDALEYIKQTKHEKGDLTTVIILDVLMPLMNGPAFVEAFESLPKEVQESYHIIALTSSMNKHDMEKISSYKAVKDLLDKPITSESILPLLVNR